MTGPVVSIGRLPATSGKLFGRDDDLAWLDAAWEQKAHVATIVAFGGVGKTSLVNKWLARMRDKGWGGAERFVAWSFYSQGTERLSSADAFIAKALADLGDPDPAEGSAWAKGERLSKLMRQRKTILVLDGVEPLQWGSGVLSGKLRDDGLAALVTALAWENNGLCLITSRIGLTDLDGLTGDKVRTKDLRNLPPEAGAKLLQARGAWGTDKELRAASREYKGHGLALTLLGSYLAEVAEGDIRRRKVVGPLEKAEQHGGHARRVMKSYEPLLGKPEVAILRMIGLFDRPAEENEIAALRAGPVVRGLTDALAGIGGRDWNKAVAKLRNVGLLSADQDEGLDAHPLVREHFGEQLRRERPKAWRAGHRRLYEHLKRKAKELPETVEEMAPLYAAVVHGCLAGKNQEALDEVFKDRIHRGDEQFNWTKLGAFGSEVAVLSAFFDPPWERLAPGLSEPDEAWVQHQAAIALRALGRLSEAAGLMRLVLARDIAQEEWGDAATGASNLSELLQTHGKLHEALLQARKSVTFADESGNAAERESDRTTLAAAQHALGLRAEAAAQFEEAERMQRDRWPARPWLFAIQGFRYCDLLLDQGRDADVRERAAQMLAEVPRPRWYAQLDIALDHLSLGRAHLLGAQRGTGGDLAFATSHIEQAVDDLRRAGQQDELPLGLLARAALHTHTGDFPAAHRDLDEALALATGCEFRLREADSHLGFARLYLAEDRPDLARPHLEKAKRIIDQTGYHRRDGELAELTARCEEHEKRTARAQGTQGEEGKEGGEGISNPLFLAPLALSLPGAPAVKSGLVDTPPAPEPTPAPSIATMTKPAVTTPVDLGIVIALPEELRALLDLTSHAYEPHPDPNLSAYLFTHGTYRCAVTLTGEMGQSQAVMFTERLIAAVDPGVLVSIGIAGGLNDLHAGDIHVPSQAVEYLQDSKAEATADGGFTIIPGAPAYRPDFTLHKEILNFEFRHRAAHQTWVAACAADFAELLPDEAKRAELIAAKQVGAKVQALVDGHVATGPVVGASKAFSGRIRCHDRQIKSIEMESAAVLLAAQNRHEPKRAIVLRAISDFGDEHKKELDKKGDGVLRKYSMRNAVRLLWALLDAEAFPHRPR